MSLWEWRILPMMEYIRVSVRFVGPSQAWFAGLLFYIRLLFFEKFFLARNLCVLKLGPLGV